MPSLYTIAPWFLGLLVVLQCSLLVVAQTVGPSEHPLPVTEESIASITNLSNDMISRWEILDANCDPRVVFAITYLYMTANAKVLVENLYFDDGNKMASYIVHFASRYIAAFDAYEANQTSEVSLPWLRAFSFAASGYSNASEDLFLGMNAHINYDLAIATYQQGYANLEWKPDFDRVNDLMNNISSDVILAIGQRYDPFFLSTNLLVDYFFNLTLQMVIEWREAAWTTAVTYDAATFLLVPTLETTNALTVGTLAVSFSVPYYTSTAASRVAYCMAHHAPWSY